MTSSEARTNLPLAPQGQRKGRAWLQRTLTWRQFLDAMYAMYPTVGIHEVGTTPA
jgi:hypothetical protein